MQKYSPRRILSGIQPTGQLTLGNYLGAIDNWVKMQSNNNNIYDNILYSIVDLHALTIKISPNELKNNIMNMTANLLGCGLNPDKSIIFRQSHVSGHTELSWLLSCIVPYASLQTMTQFKDKSKKVQDGTTLGLFSYPVLMTADILLYKATEVPVGDDQTQHLELARNIARRFNKQYKYDMFPIPEQYLSNVTRVMSLRDGTKKMSKSDPSDKSRINILDTNDMIQKKIRKAKTDSIEYITYDEINRPELANLLRIYAMLNEKNIDECLNEFKNGNFGTVKNALIDILIEKLTPIRKKIQEYQNDRAYLEQILKNGANRANEIAIPTLNQTKSLMGIL